MTTIQQEQKKITLIIKMFNTKIKFLPPRDGERFGSSMPNNNAFIYLGYKAKININDYIINIIKKK